MKNIFPVLVFLFLFSSACGAETAQPTAITAPTLPPIEVSLTEIVSEDEDDANPEAGDERVSSVDGMTQVYIPEGIFLMGGVDPNARMNEVPARSVTISAFWMDKFEVTNAMYTMCVRAGACTPPQVFKSQKREMYVNNPEFVDFPVVYVTWIQADTYCKWVERRLPTEAEWEYAARGDDFRTYPWGDDPPNTSRGNFNLFVGDTARVGSYPAGASPFGVLDMAGNVSEWVADFYDAEYYSKGVMVNPKGPDTRVNYFHRVIRGGNFQDAFKDIRLANRTGLRGSNPGASNPQSADYLGEFSPKIGFRCASD